MSTAEVLDHHLAAFGAADVDEIMIDYADEAVFYTPYSQSSPCVDHAWRTWSISSSRSCSFLPGLVSRCILSSAKSRSPCPARFTLCRTGSTSSFRLEQSCDVDMFTM